MQLSLVACYGEKPEPLAHLILQLQQQLSGHLGTVFRPYALAQVHGTILGLEAEAGEGGVYHRWFLENRGIRHPVDLRGLITYLQQESPEIHVRIGGYAADTDYGFSSRGRHPYLRSFSVQGQIAVAMGWPVGERGGKLVFSDALFAWRRSFEQFQVCHKWHKEGYTDNDFFFVLGRIDIGAVDQALLEQVSAHLCHWMSENASQVVLNRDALSLVAYEDTELPLESSRVFPLTGFGLSPEQLLAIYG